MASGGADYITINYYPPLSMASGGTDYITINYYPPLSMASGGTDDPYFESEGADDRKIIVRMLNYKTTNETIREYFG